MEQQVTEEIKPEETPPEKPPEIAPEIIQEAMDTGWIPEEQFKGDKTKWRPADQWVERGRTLIPIIKSQVKDYKTEIDSLKQILDAQKKTTEKLIKMSMTVGEQAYERAKRELTEKQMAAVKEGDVDTFTAIEKEKENLKRPEPIVEEVPANPIFDSWHKNNNWYKAIGTNAGDEDLTIYADSYSARLKAQSPNMSVQELYDQTAKKVREVFPHKFENAARSIPSIVDSSGVMAVAQKADAKTYANLPADAKAQCDAFVKDGLLTQEKYVKEYPWEG